MTMNSLLQKNQIYKEDSDKWSELYVFEAAAV